MSQTRVYFVITQKQTILRFFPKQNEIKKVRRFKEIHKLVIKQVFRITFYLEKSFH